MKKLKLKFRELFNYLNCSSYKYDSIFKVDKEIYILTPHGDYSKLEGCIRKKDEKIKIKCEDISFICGKNHILINENNELEFAKNVNQIQTINGPKNILEKIYVEYGDVYDISIQEPHLYITPNGVIHHNTTSAKAMCNELGIDVLFLNASEQGGIDIVRTQIRSFASTVSFFEGKHKCVILDESDNLPANSSQLALRGFFEEFAGNCRFILTANFGNRILDAIKSRCAVIDFTLSKEEKQECIVLFMKRMKQILENENVSFDKITLANIIKKYFPDYRKIINEVQRNSRDGKFEISELKPLSDESVKEVIQAIQQKKFGEIKNWVVNNSDIDFHLLIKTIYEKMLDFNIEANSIPDLILILSEYDYKRSFVMNPEIHTLAMLCSVMGEVKFK